MRISKQNISHQKNQTGGLQAGENSPERYLTFYFALFVGLAALLSFSSGLKGQFVWDDEYVISKNLFIRDIRNIPLIFSKEYFAPAGIGHYTRSGEESFRPAVTLVHCLEYQIFHLNPMGYHAVSLLLHTGTCIALYYLLIALGLGLSGAFAGAILFAVHPLNSEAVNMISYREDVLAGLFVVLALRMFIKNRFFPFGIFTALAMLSKEMGLIILPMILGYTFLNLSREKPRHRCIITAILVTGIYLVLFFLIFPSHQSVSVQYPGPSIDATLGTMARVICTYLKLFVFPFPLKADYDFSISTTLFCLSSGLCLLIIVLIIAWPVVFKWKKLPTMLLMWFFIALLPVSGVYPIKNIIAERYLYIPIMGLCALSGYGFHWMEFRSNRYKTIAHLLLLVAALTGISMNNLRNRIWWDEAGFFKAMIKTNPDSHKGFSSLGMIMYRSGNHEAAEKNLKRSLEIDPDNEIARHNLGCLYQTSNRYDQAEEIFKENIRRNPGFIESRYQLAVLYRSEGRITDARKELETVLTINPNFIPAKFVLGSILQENKEYQRAEKLYLAILKVDPHYSKALKNLGVLYTYYLNNPRAAIKMFSAYLTENPDDPQKEAIQQVIDAAKSSL